MRDLKSESQEQQLKGAAGKAKGRPRLASHLGARCRRQSGTRPPDTRTPSARSSAALSCGAEPYPPNRPPAAMTR
jgi:hypothetical protein